MSFGLGNYLYDLDVSGGAANFKFRDPEDSDNTAEVSVSEKDFGGFNADSRQVAEVAYAQVCKALNDKRDARVKKQTAAAVDADLTEKARVREAADDFLNNAQDVSVAPAKVEEDGTKVYHAGESEETTDTSEGSSSKKTK